MRSIAVLLALTLTGSWAVVEALPEGQVRAEPQAARTQEVHSISIDGGRGLPIAQLRESMTTKIGSTVDTATLATDRRAMQATLSARGYLAAKVSDPVVTYGPSGGAYVVFDVDRGALYHVRSITLVGPHWKDIGVVTLAPGDEAIDGRLQRVRQTAQATLVRLGKKEAHVDLVVLPDTDEPLVDIRLVTR